MYLYEKSCARVLGKGLVRSDYDIIAQLSLSIKIIHHDSSKTTSGSFNIKMSLLNRISTLADGELSGQ